jgi:hypothetical protein
MEDIEETNRLPVTEETKQLMLKSYLALLTFVSTNTSQITENVREYKGVAPPLPSSHISQEAVLDNPSELTCTICCDPLHKSRRTVTLACSHPFHSSCISDWVSRKRACPVCRAMIVL